MNTLAKAELFASNPLGNPDMGVVQWLRAPTHFVNLHF